MSEVLVTPGGTITDGTIVTLQQYPEVQWIVHNGWYTYQSRQYMGWYLVSIPSQNVLPLDPDDLIGITIVSSGCGPCPVPPGPNPPRPPIPHDVIHEIERAWITVDTIEQLSRLNRRLVPDGKIVRVNDIGDGTSKYYRYDQPNQKWVEETFGIDTENLVSQNDLENSVVNIIKDNSDIHQTIHELVDLNWKTIE